LRSNKTFLGYLFLMVGLGILYGGETHENLPLVFVSLIPLGLALGAFISSLVGIWRGK
jgi:hypothetical protein